MKSEAEVRVDSLFEALTEDQVGGSRLPALAGLAVVAVEAGKTVYEGYFGRRRIDPADPSCDLPVTRDTKFRVASMSKPITCIGAMLLVEEGLLDLGRDVSDYLGFRLRHPQHPEVPITAAMLLSHTSSLRDDENYTVPFGGRLEEMFTPDSPLYADGRHFAPPVPESDTAPGRYFEYCNLNFGVLATIMEMVTGERFDLYMQSRVLDPLGVVASYNVNLLDDAAFAEIGALYRKAPGSEGPWDPAGPWLPQVDDYRGKRPKLALRYNPGPEGQFPELSTYEIGSNGTMFSPQGGLRISPADYSKLMRVFMEGGRCGSARVLAESSVRDMMTMRWKYDPELKNGESYYGMTRESGLALFRTTDSQDGSGCDRLVPEGGVRMWGHHGDAYGYLGAALFDPESGRGFVYSISGTAADPMVNRGSYSSWFVWEELIQKTLLGEIFGVRPGVTGA